MSNSLRARINKLVYKGYITRKDGDKIREALLKFREENNKIIEDNRKLTNENIRTCITTLHTFYCEEGCLSKTCEGCDYNKAIGLIYGMLEGNNG